MGLRHTSSQDNSCITNSKDTIANSSDLVQSVPFVNHVTNARKSKPYTAEALDIHIECILGKELDKERNYSEMFIASNGFQRKRKKSF